LAGVFTALYYRTFFRSDGLLHTERSVQGGFVSESAAGNDLNAFWAALADRYVLERPLGAGGMAVVFLAHDVRHDRPVAIKILRSDLAEMAHGERFAREIKIVARFAHPHILSVFDSGEVDRHPYFVMPFVEGESLRARLEREHRLPVREAVRLARQIADALHYAHEHGVVHRDIKPENILLESGHAVVADFGIARVMSGGDGRVTTVGMTLGTPAYMSPEQITGEATVDRRTDIYSLGCVLFEMLTGRSPFAGKNTQQLIAGHVTQVPPRVRELRAEAPAAVEAVVARALAKSVDDRYATAGELAEALDAPMSTPVDAGVTGAMTGAVPAGAGTVARAAAPARWSWSRRLAMVAAVAALVAAVYGVRQFGPEALGGRARLPVDRNLLAVAPFQSYEPGLALWREGMMDMLSRNFDGAGPIRTVSPTIVTRRWRGRPDLESARALGEATGAGLVIVGQLTSSGADSVRASATVYDVTGDSALARDVDVLGTSARMDGLTDSLTLQVLRSLPSTRNVGAVLRLRPALGARSLSALKAFLQGEQLYRKNDFVAARPYYEQAIALDTGFALALRRMRGVLRGGGQSEFDSLSLDYALRAGRANRGLTVRDSLLVVADSLAGAMPFLAGFVDDAYVARLRRRHEILALAAQRFAQDPEVWDELGEVRAHFGDRIGIDQERALSAFERAIALDSAYGPAYYHAIELSLTQRSTDTTRQYLHAYRKVNPNDARFKVLDGILERADRPTSEVDAWLRTQPATARSTVARMIARWPDSSETAIRMFRELLAHPEGLADDDARFTRSWVIRSLLFRGHAADAAALVDTTFAGLYPHRVVQMALFGAIAPDSARRMFRRWLVSTDLSRVVQTLPWWSVDGDTASMRKVWQRSDSILRIARSYEDRVDAAYGVSAARARMALARGDSSAALELFRQLPDSLLPFTRYFERYDRARVLSARGQLRDAAVVLDAFPPAEYTLTVSKVVWWIERARIARRLGDRDLARRGYTFVRRTWARSTDPQIKRFVLEAEQALATTVAMSVDSGLLATRPKEDDIRAGMTLR
jgi:serine/threonine-protein kinase